MYKHILMPIDGSSCSEHVTAQGLALAKLFGADVTFLYVLENPISHIYAAPEGVPYALELYEDLKKTGHAALEKADSQASEADVPAKTLLQEGSNPTQTILSAEEDFDLIIIGTHGRRGFDRWVLGSVTEGLLRKSSKPHLVIRCPEESE